MNIAVLSLHLPSPARAKTGGVAYVAHRLADGLAKRGHGVTVFSTDGGPPGARYQVRCMHTRESSGALGNWLQNWQVARAYAAQDFRSFDVIHAHGDDALIWKPGPPLVRTFHGAALAESIYAPTWKRRLWYLAFAPRETWEAAKADVAVAVSHNTRRYIPFLDTVIPNAVDPAVFHPAGTPAHHPTILFVGTLAGRKRGRLLVELFQSQIRAAIPDAELWLVAERQVHGAGIRCYEQPDERELAELYRQAWVFCLPSSYEGFGVPYIEAMACGTPVVATPNPGAREVLGEGKWGFIVDPAALGQTLLSLLADAEARERWSQRGLERAQSFMLDRVLDAYESLFTQAIRQRKA